MNTHYCKVGTVRPNMDKVEDSQEIESNSIKQKSEKMPPVDESSK